MDEIVRFVKHKTSSKPVPNRFELVFVRFGPKRQKMEHFLFGLSNQTFRFRMSTVRISTFSIKFDFFN